MSNAFKDYEERTQHARHEINKRLQETIVLLHAELKRIIELLEQKEYISVSWYCSNSGIRAELKNKMAEARRDMKRLEKLMYMQPYDYEKLGMIMRG